MSERIRILVADDEYSTRNGVRATLLEWSKGEMDVHCAENGLEALEMTKKLGPQLIITDIRMPGLSGIDLLRTLRTDGWETPVILLTGFAEFDYAREAVQYGACNYILKPADREELISSTEHGLAAANRLAQEKEKARHERNSSNDNDRNRDIPKVRNTFIQIALTYIHQNYTMQTLGIKEVADHIPLNPSYVSVLFKEETNLTFSEYLLRLRLSRAKELIEQTDLKMYEIAERVGFSSSKYFVKVFREMEQTTPKHYRKSSSRSARVH